MLNWTETSSTVCLRPQCAVSSTFYSTVTLNFDLLTSKTVFVSVPKFTGAIISLVKIRPIQDNMFIMF